MERVKELKPELLNNIAVTHQTLGNFSDAEHYYGLAIQESETSKGDEKNLKLTMSYNLARLYEERLETEKAIAIYRKIIEDYPAYIDGKIRNIFCLSVSNFYLFSPFTHGCDRNDIG